MVPVYLPGDHVLIFSWLNYRVGDVIVFRQKGKNYIKRIKQIWGQTYFVGGDNLRESAPDFKVRNGEIWGKVIFKY